jgi:nicotinamidase-related amidase
LGKYALIVVDMIKGNIDLNRNGPMDIEAGKIIPNIRELIQGFRENDHKVVFSCDSFMEGDFIFGGRMPPHAIRGTGQDYPIDELGMLPTDHYLPKRRMSSFFKTDLDQSLRTWGVQTAVVCGIVTNVCVLLTAIDAMQNDFKSVIVSDACACHKPEIHETTLKLYSPNILEPLIRVLSADEILEEIK